MARRANGRMHPSPPRYAPSRAATTAATTRAALAHGHHAPRTLAAALNEASHRLEKLFQVREEQVVLAAVVRVERRAGNLRAVEHVLHRERVEPLLLQKPNQRIAQPIARAADAAV